MNIVMITCNREPAYVDATLESLLSSDESIEKVHVLVHEVDVACLAQWLNHPKVDWRKLLPEEHDAKMMLPRRTRVCHAMRLALEDIGDGECIFLEDDAVFSPNWLQTFLRELEASTLKREDAMIVLRSHLRFQKDGFVRWNPSSYYGTVAVYFGSMAHAYAIKALGEGERSKHASPGIGSDVALKNMLLKTPQVQLYARFPNLIEHTGKVSSIASTPVRQHQIEREATGKAERPRVVWPEKQSRPSAPTNAVVNPAPGVTTKPRKNPNPPVVWGKKT